MKKTFGFLLICATLALLSMSVLANKPYVGADGALQDACSTEAKAALYAEFYKAITAVPADQAKAVDLAKKYVACPNPSTEAAEVTKVEYLKNFITKFEKAHRKDQLAELINKKDYPAAFEIGKQVFADDPDYLQGYMTLALAGALSQNQALANDTITYAQKAIQMIESGKTPDPKKPDSWVPFDNKDDALAKLNYAIGSLKAGTSPDSAIPHLIKAASYNSKIKSTPVTYAYLAESYERGPYLKQSAEYKEKCVGKDETADCKLLLENVNQLIDRIIDAYARAVALAGTDPNKATWMGSLTDLYKFRHDKTDVGLDKLIAGILNTPLPPVPTPITTLPTPTPAAAGTGTTTTGSAAPPTATGTPATGSQPKPTPTPVKPPTTPGKPRTRKAHAGH
jgi:tetratricopeptide (TPR) repeat protein